MWCFHTKLTYKDKVQIRAQKIQLLSTLGNVECTDVKSFLHELIICFELKIVKSGESWLHIGVNDIFYKIWYEVWNQNSNFSEICILNRGIFTKWFKKKIVLLTK